MGLPMQGVVALIPRSKAMSSYVGCRGAVGERLEAVRADAREVDLGVAVAGEVLAGDAHAPDLDLLPALVARVEPGVLAGREPPELLLALVVVVVPVVRDAQVAAARAVPVAEEHRERAVRPAVEGRRRREALAAARGPDEDVGRAVGEALLVDVVDVVPERERRPRLAALPGRAERRRPGIAAVERPGLVRALEGAVAEPAQEHVLALAEHARGRGRRRSRCRADRPR